MSARGVGTDPDEMEGVRSWPETVNFKTLRSFLGFTGYNSKQFVKLYAKIVKVSKGAKIRNRYNQVPHLTQDTNGKVTNSQLYTTSERQEVSLFPAGDHKAQKQTLTKA